MPKITIISHKIWSFLEETIIEVTRQKVTRAWVSNLSLAGQRHHQVSVQDISFTGTLHVVDADLILLDLALSYSVHLPRKAISIVCN